MGTEVGFYFEDWIQSFNRSKEELFRALLGEIDSTFYDMVLFRTPEDDVTKKGKAKTTAEHIKMNWQHVVDEDGRGVSISNPFVYGPVLDLGLYPGEGPRTVANEGGIFSKMGPKGIVQPMIKDEAILKKAINMIVQKVSQRSGMLSNVR